MLQCVSQRGITGVLSVPGCESRQCFKNHEQSSWFLNQWHTRRGIASSMAACRESAVPLTELLFVVVQITARKAWHVQRGKHFSSPHRQALDLSSTFPDGHSSTRLSWSCFRWPHPVIPSVQPRQPSHYFLQLFGTGNLIPAPQRRPLCEVGWWKSLPPYLGPALL